MSGCCGPAPETPGSDPERYRSVFNAGFSRSIARRYERKGLRPAEQRIVDFVASTGLDGASVLEIGGGAGEIQLELLARGAARTENLELSDAYEADAVRLIRHAGMTGRVSRRLGVDLAASHDDVEPADVVVLHRVVCCYPDATALLTAAAAHARHALVFSYPPAGGLSRMVTAFTNGMMRLGGRSYRAFVHDPAAMIGAVRGQGLEPVYSWDRGTWRIAGAVRT